MKSHGTKALILASFLIGIIAIITPVLAANHNRFLFMAKGDDLDLPRTSNFIIGKINFGGDAEIPTAGVFFYSKINDESGKKVYSMVGMLKDGLLLMTDYSFYCPVFNVWWINVWYVMGEGKFRTTNSDVTVFFRKSLPITMPNTEGRFESAPILLMLSPTAEYYEFNPEDPNYPPGTPENPVKVWDQGGWALAAVVWEVETPVGPMVLPVGPVSYLTKYMEF